MATQTEATTAMPYPPLPASPTLTNPDMILPDYADYADYDRASSPERPESPLTHWKNVHAADLQQFSLATSQAMLGQGFVTGPMTPTTPIIYGNGTMLSDIGEVTEVETTPVKKPAPRQTMTTTATTPTQRASTTSASTTAPSANAHAASAASAALAAVVGSGGPSAAAGSGISSGPESAAAAIKKGGRSPAHSSDDAALRSSPTMGTAGAVYEPIKKRAAAARKAAAAAAHERRSSIDSNSTITTQDQQVLFADFDDTISVDDSVFQGDDEESVADSYVDASEPAGRPVADQHDGTLGQSSSLTPKGGSGDEDRTRYSTVSLSRRAEKILANAKRRLTTMEGNLSRARSSLYITSPTSLRSFDSGDSTPSPPIVRASTSTSHHRDIGHARMLSDTSVENDVTPALYPKRSASALGAAGGYRQPLQGSKSVEHMRDGTNLNGSRGQANHLKSSLHSREFALEPLSEDEVGGGGAKFDRHLRPGRKADSFLSPKFGPENRDPPRPASAAQVRDLKDQMKDLKGKISSLREQARADSLKRRSFQSLRSESPFTQGGTEQWYAGRGASAGIGGSTPSSVRNPWNGEESSVDGDNVPQSRHLAAQDREAEEDEESIISGYTEGEQTGPTKVSRVPVQVTVSHLHESGVTVDEGVAEVVEGSEFDEVDVADMDDMQTEDGYDDELQGNGAADYESESGESLYHDTMQTPLSHEDREDAFDYEHFFLHSAMGTISQQRLARRGSTSSLGSDDSVETTRGPIVSNEGKPNGMVRRGSTASTTTMESFATADEGRSVKSRGATPPKATDKRPKTPDTAQRDKSASRRISDEGSSSSGSVNGSGAGRGGHQRQNSVIHVGAGDRRPASVSAAALSLHRPSVSSFESTGTQRSFPLVNKAKLLQQQAAATVTNAGQASASSAATGVLTPQGSPDPAADMRRLSDNTFFSDTSSILSVGGKGAGTGAAMQSLSREDQLLVERLVASLGRCVLGLTEAPRGTAESREFRRRIDLARRLLEGSEEMG